jgi:hypothetical protein
VSSKDEVDQITEVLEDLTRILIILGDDVDVYEVDWSILYSNAGPGYTLIEGLYCLESWFFA